MLINNKWLLISMCSLFLFAQSEIKTLNLSSRELRFANSVSSADHTSEVDIATIVELQRFVKKNLLADNPIQKLFSEPATQWLVEEFFLYTIQSKDIVEKVTYYTEKKGLPVDIVFSLVFVESSFSTQAVNFNKNDTKDLGLFQLNSRTFRHLAPDDFFRLDVNVDMGTSYLQYAFSLDPDPNTALAIYNAGPSRPLRGQTPDSTKLYVKKIINHAQKLESEFVYYVWNKLELTSVDGNV